MVRGDEKRDAVSEETSAESKYLSSNTLGRYIGARRRSVLHVSWTPMHAMRHTVVYTALRRTVDVGGVGVCCVVELEYRIVACADPSPLGESDLASSAGLRWTGLCTADNTSNIPS